MAKKNDKKTIRKAGSAPMPGLLSSLLKDVFIRHWLTSLLLVICLLSAVKLAQNSHQQRRATAQLQALTESNEEQQLVWDSMRLEYAALTEPDRVASLAKKKLGMIEVNAKNEKVISQ